MWEIQHIAPMRSLKITAKGYDLQVFLLFWTHWEVTSSLRVSMLPKCTTVLREPAPFPIANPDPCHFWWKFKKIKPMVRPPPSINHQRFQVVVLPLAAAPSESFPWQAVLFLKTILLICLKLMSSSFFGQNRAAWFPQTFEKTVHSHDSSVRFTRLTTSKKNLPSLKFCLASHKHVSDPPFFGSWFCWLSITCLEKLFLFKIQTGKPSPGPSAGNLLRLAFETCSTTTQRSWLRNIGHRPRAFSFKFETSSAERKNPWYAISPGEWWFDL